MRLLIIIVYLSLHCCFTTVTAQTFNERVVAALEKNDHGTLVSCFHSLVDLQIPGYTGSFSQSQSSVILKKFLSDHPVAGVEISKSGDTSDGGNFSMGELVSAGKKYRLYIVSRETEGKQRVFVLKITAI